MHQFRILLLFTIIPCMLGLGCKPQPVQPELAQPEAVSTVVLINVSGMAPLLLPAMEQLGATPHISALRETGMVGTLSGGSPVAFAGATISMLTGQSCENQGVDFWFFTDKEKKNLYGFESGHIKIKTLFQILANRNLPSLSVFWPVTHPAFQAGGDIISPGPIPDRKTIGDFTFVPDLSPGLADRCSLAKLCNEADSILGKTEPEEEILNRFLSSEILDAPFAEILKMDLIESYRADRAAMNLVESLWNKNHRLVAVNLVGAGILGRRLYDQFDPKNFQVSEQSFKNQGRILSKYYKFIDEFIGRIKTRLGSSGIIILVSDHGLGPAGPMDQKRFEMPGRAHPIGLYIINGPGISLGPIQKRLKPYHLTPLILRLLGQPLAQDMESGPIDQINSIPKAASIIATYEGGKANPSPARPFGRFITDQDRYTRFEELPQPASR